MNRYSGVMYAKYDRSRMNDVHAQYVRPTLSASWQKSYGQLHSFQKMKVIFVWLLCWPLASQPGSQLMNCV